MLWQNGLRRLLFCLPAERAHYLSMGIFSNVAIPPLAAALRKRYSVDDSRLTTSAFGLPFKNPVGLAAGFDKDAAWFNKLFALGFSHVEVGTITGQGQPGNPQPRLFRLPEDRAIINRMGFNNSGADAAARRLSANPKQSATDILGINIGKTKIVPLSEATADYRFSFERLFSFADYFTVNVSSPNTPGLRELQNREQLLELLSSLQELNQELSADHDIETKPILLKIAPDLNDNQIEDIVEIVRQIHLSGVIATNTTIGRGNLKSPPDRVKKIGNGGLSGAPLTQRSRAVVRQLHTQLEGTVPIVGVGGIMSGEDAWQMILAGATLVQLYTGFIYGGPGIVRDLNRYLLKKLSDNQLENVGQAVGGWEQFD
jgi:dihydroorotate dehydrogenase